MRTCRSPQKKALHQLKNHKEAKMVDGMTIEVKNVKSIVYDGKEEYVTLILGSDFKIRQHKFKKIPVSEHLNIAVKDSNTVIITEDYD